MADVDLAVVQFDANFLIDVLKGRSGPARLIEKWTEQKAVLQISSIAWSEFLCGPLDDSDVEDAHALINSVEAFSGPDAELASHLFNETGRHSRSHVDCMIAAHAIRRDAVLATSNSKDFRRFEQFDLQLAAEFDL